jgi:hypothetical protein
MRRMRIWLVDGVPHLGTEEAATAIGSTPSSLSNTAHLNEREHGKGCVFTLKGHTVQGQGLATELPEEEKSYPAPDEDLDPVSAPAPIPAIPLPLQEPSDEELLTIELRAVKEQLRFLRECLISRLHGVDEIAENVHAIERRIIDPKEKSKGSYHGSADHQAERLG